MVGKVLAILSLPDVQERYLIQSLQSYCITSFLINPLKLYKVGSERGLGTVGYS